MTGDNISKDEAARTLIAKFARRKIDGRDDLRDHAVIPPALWRAIGDTGLARIGLPEEYGGMGGDLRTLALAAEAICAEGGVKGVATCWLGRQLIARLQILTHGTPEQKRYYLPKLAAGEITPCLAISEPGAGAHPKHLTTAAVRDGSDFVVSGEKAYLTNGPIADIFLVLAITGTVAGRKQYSVLIVPREAGGMEITEGVKVDFIRPAPHCGLRLNNVRVPAANLLGPEGDAFAQISLPMRVTEDALFAATIAGSLRHMIERLARELGGTVLDDAALDSLGRLAAAPDGLAALAYRAAELLDLEAENAADTVRNIAAAARGWARGAQAQSAELMARPGFSPSPGLLAESRDIEKTLGIARSAHIIQSQRRARALLAT